MEEVKGVQGKAHLEAGQKLKMKEIGLQLILNLLRTMPLHKEDKEEIEGKLNALVASNRDILQEIALIKMTEEALSANVTMMEVQIEEMKVGLTTSREKMAGTISKVKHLSKIMQAG